MEIQEALGVTDLPDTFISNYGRVKFALELNAVDENVGVVEDIKPSDIKNALIIEAAIRGHSKRKISDTLKCSVTSVERHVYSSQGQARMVEALEITQVAINTTLPLLVSQALIVLEDVLNGGDAKKLQAVDRILSLHQRVVSMAHLSAPVVKQNRTKSVNAEVNHTV
jgi:hypothetical protein